MDQTKSALASTGVWGSIIAIAGALAPLALTKAGVANASDQQSVIASVGQTAAAIGGIIALVGRLGARKQLL